MIQSILKAVPELGGADTGLAHLSGPAAPVRQVIAAHFLRDFAHVVEIGGSVMPITGFLTHRPQSVLSVDPHTKPFEAETLNGAPCRVRHLARKFQEVSFDLAPRSYGLAMIGFSLRGFGGSDPAGAALFGLLDNAGVVVIDYALALERASSMIPTILSRPGLKTEFTVDLTLDDAAIANSPFAARRLLVLRPKV
ncbi:MAG: hypothetical protein JNL61_13440 [Rhizobiaceae bacterium]|nr:hypothetical protein [Rhizobiaceae bacterium]